MHRSRRNRRCVQLSNNPVLVKCSLGVLKDPRQRSRSRYDLESNSFGVAELGILIAAFRLSVPQRYECAAHSRAAQYPTCIVSLTCNIILTMRLKIAIYSLLMIALACIFAVSSPR